MSFATNYFFLDDYPSTISSEALSKETGGTISDKHFQTTTDVPSSTFVELTGSKINATTFHIGKDNTTSTVYPKGISIETAETISNKQFQNITDVPSSTVSELAVAEITTTNFSVGKDNVTTLKTFQGSNTGKSKYSHITIIFKN